jgi:ribonuclease HI
LHVYADASLDEPVLSCGYVITRSRGREKDFVDAGCRILNIEETRADIDYCSSRGEYRALITAVRAALDHAEEPLILYSDCDCVVDNVRGDNDIFETYFPHALFSFVGRFTDWHITNISRERNELAHEQARIGLKLGRDIIDEVNR